MDELYISVCSHEEKSTGIWTGLLKNSGMQLGI